MRTSNPPSYDKIFAIYSGSGTLTDYVVPSHRGLLLINTSTTTTTTSTTITNIDGTTVTLAIAPGATLLPLQIWKVTQTTASGIRIYGLV